MGGARTTETSATAVPFADLTRQHRSLAGELRAAFDRVVGSSDFTLGEEVRAFEAEFAQYCGVAYCVGVSSGTAALTIMLRAAGIGRGDEVILPAHTFIATALAVIHAGATPVYADVERGTGLIDPAAVETAIGPATAAILPVHLYGQACKMGALAELAQRHRLVLLEDAAQAHGATHDGVRAGALGRAAAFSFYPSKNLGALGDAGAICTDDSELAAAARRLRDLGRDVNRLHAVAGYNARLDGIQAALLRVKLPHLDGWNAARRLVADGYRSSLDGVELLEELPESPCVYHIFPVRVPHRHDLARHLLARGIGTAVHYPVALPDQPPLSDARTVRTSPSARDWAARELSLPIFPGMTDDELTTVTGAVLEWVSVRAERDGVSLRG